MTPAQFLKQFNSVKTLPHVAIRLTKLVSNEHSSIQEFEKIIKMDPTLVLRLLRLVNSPYFGVAQKIDSIARAVVFVGMDNLRNMVVTEALRDIFNSDMNEGIFSRSHLWFHCVAVSICSQMISERIFSKNGEDAFLCGILHDIGMIVEVQVAPDPFARICTAHASGSSPFIEAERDIIGTDHSAVGYLLARDWKLPIEVQKAIRQHHKVIEEVSPHSITGIIQIAEYIVSRLSYSAIPGMESKLSPSLLTHMRDNIEEYKIIIQELPEEIAMAKDLYASQGT